MRPEAFAEMVVLTIKAGLAPVLERLASAEARLSQAAAVEQTLADLRDRLVAVETKAAIPMPAPQSAPTVDLAPLGERIGRLENSPFVGATKEFWSTLNETVVTLRERVAVLEVRPLQPGPQGEPGPAGKDGTAGLSFEGVYQEGKSYDFGHLVTWAGSSWHCNEPTTTKPGEGSKAWTLMVKRGRDGKDGHDGRDLAPVVSVGVAR